MLTCEVTCDGLAFQELGKRGYIYDLSVADYELVYKEWQEAGGFEISRPRENVQFWCDKIGLKPTPMSEKDIDPFPLSYPATISTTSPIPFILSLVLGGITSSAGRTYRYKPDWLPEPSFRWKSTIG